MGFASNLTLHLKDTPFTHDSQGSDWFSQFMRKWKIVASQSIPPHLSRKHAKALTSDMGLKSGWSLLSESIEKWGCSD